LLASSSSALPSVGYDHNDDDADVDAVAGIGSRERFCGSLKN
jgi:hypothetical protein